MPVSQASKIWAHGLFFTEVRLPPVGHPAMGQLVLEANSCLEP